MFAPVYHQAMKYAGPVRKALAFVRYSISLDRWRTQQVPTVELMGVYDKSLVEPLAPRIG